MKLLSLFNHPQVVLNLYEFISSAEHKRMYFEEFGRSKSFWYLLTGIVSFFKLRNRSRNKKKVNYFYNLKSYYN